MDPASALGAAASVAGIVDILSRTLVALYGMHQRLQGADFTLTALIGELEVAKAALKQLQTLIDESREEDQHHQLILDLKTSLDYCHLLVSFVDEKVSKLEWSEGSGTATFRSRLSVVLDDKETKSCLERLTRSMVSINLNIDAYKCRSPERQKEILYDKRNRTIFDQIKDDTSSLIVLCDVASACTLRTNTTTATSMLSTRLSGIDEQLLKMNLYHRMIPGMVRRARRGMSPSPAVQDLASESTGGERERNRKSRENTKRINKMLEVDRWRKKSEVDVLVLGHQYHVAETVRRMKALVDGVETGKNPKAYLAQILELTITSMQELLFVMSEHEEAWALPEHETFIQTLRKAKYRSQDSHLPGNVARALQILWPRWRRMENYSDVVTKAWNNSFLTREPQAYFFDHVQRLAEPGYTPSGEDIRRLPADQGPGISETKLTLKRLRVNFIQIHKGGSERWIQSYEHVDYICFVVDLLSYNQRVLDDQTGSLRTILMKQLEEFESVVYSRWFSNKDIILLMQYELESFRVRLDTDPLSNYFPRFYGGVDVEKAKEYLLSEFEQLFAQANPYAKLHHHYILGSLDRGFVKFIKVTLNDMSVAEILKASGYQQVALDTYLVPKRGRRR